jgi:hypothetical protein
VTDKVSFCFLCPVSFSQFGNDGLPLPLGGRFYQGHSISQHCCSYQAVQNSSTALPPPLLAEANLLDVQLSSRTSFSLVPSTTVYLGHRHVVKRTQHNASKPTTMAAHAKAGSELGISSVKRFREQNLEFRSLPSSADQSRSGRCRGGWWW